jgi:hypothetical protein
MANFAALVLTCSGSSACLATFLEGFIQNASRFHNPPICCVCEYERATGVRRAINQGKKMEALLNVAAIGTRLICILIGFAIAASFAFAAFLATAGPQGEPFTPLWKTFLATTGVGLVFASGYIMFAIGWQARFARLPFRAINAVLLLLPFTAQVMIIRLHRFPILPSYAAVSVVLFTAWLMLLCAKPGLLAIGAGQGKQ